MCVKRIVSAGSFSTRKNNDTRVLTRSELPSKSHGFDTFYSKAISVCAGGLQIILTVVKLIFFINVASGCMALSYYSAASGFSLTFGKCLLWLKTD